MNTSSAATPLSWRDPDGFVVNAGGRMLRAVVKDKFAEVAALLETSWFRALVEERCIPRTWEIADPPLIMEHMERFVWLEHETVQFPCYPHEITASQLHDSAALTLRIAILAAENGWILKDASAWNVLHSRGKPVFVDLLSFERRSIGNVWVAYGQFVRHFLLPLMVYRSCGMTPAETFILNRDGLTPDRACELLGARAWSPTAVEFVMLPRWLAPAGGRLIATEASRAGQGPAIGAAPAATSPAPAAMGLDPLLQTLRRLRRKLGKLRPDPGSSKSVWKEYEEERSHYSAADLDAKKAFVRQHLGAPGSVLDIGCNAGEFSLLAAESGHQVVAADFDHGALGQLYERIRGKNLDVLAVLLNIARPTPAVGWRNWEVPAFLQRAAGRFDCILMLGLLHHLLAGERVTLAMVCDLLNALNPKRVIVEWIDPADRRFRQVAGLNAALYKDLNAGQLETAMAVGFQLVEKLVLPCSTRVMYVWKR